VEERCRKLLFPTSSMSAFRPATHLVSSISSREFNDCGALSACRHRIHCLLNCSGLSTSASSPNVCKTEMLPQYPCTLNRAFGHARTVCSPHSCIPALTERLDKVSKLPHPPMVNVSSRAGHVLRSIYHRDDDYIVTENVERSVPFLAGFYMNAQTGRL
jgi:hypothetical protein